MPSLFYPELIMNYHQIQTFLRNTFVFFIQSLFSSFPFLKFFFEKFMNSLFCFGIIYSFKFKCFSWMIQIFAISLYISVLFLLKNFTICFIYLLFLTIKWVTFLFSEDLSLVKFRIFRSLALLRAILNECSLYDFWAYS